MSAVPYPDYHRSRRKREVRGATEDPSRLSRVHLRLLPEDADAVNARPRTRGECEGGARPCPFVGCRYNLFLDVAPNGNIKYNFPDLSPEQMPAKSSCALDIADEGETTLEDLGDLANITRERIRQIETKAIRRLATNRKASILKEFVQEGRLEPAKPVNAQSRNVKSEGADEPVDDEPETITRVSFFSDNPDHDGAVAWQVWNIYEKDARGNGFRDDEIRASEARVEERRRERMKDISERDQKVISAYKEISRTQGRTPTLREIADACGFRGANENSRTASVSNTLSRLRRLGLVPMREPKPADALPKKREPKPALERWSKDHHPAAHVAPAPAPTGLSTVALLTFRRGELAHELELLDRALNIFTEVG